MIVNDPEAQSDNCHNETESSRVTLSVKAHRHFTLVVSYGANLEKREVRKDSQSRQ